MLKLTQAQCIRIRWRMMNLDLGAVQMAARLGTKSTSAIDRVRMGSERTDGKPTAVRVSAEKLCQALEMPSNPHFWDLFKAGHPDFAEQLREYDEHKARLAAAEIKPVRRVGFWNRVRAWIMT